MDITVRIAGILAEGTDRYWYAVRIDAGKGKAIAKEILKSDKKASIDTESRNEVIWVVSTLSSEELMKLDGVNSTRGEKLKK